MFQKLIDTKISIVTLVGWLIAALGLTFSVSSAYGEQKQKLIYLQDRQAKIEVTLDRTELLVRNLADTVIRIEAELKSRPAQKR